MDETGKRELINKLKEGRESMNVLSNMLEKNQRSVKAQLGLADAVKRNINDILYCLTGDEFYRVEGK